MRDIFDFDDGDFAFPLSDDYALDSDGDLMFRMDLRSKSRRSDLSRAELSAQ